MSLASLGGSKFQKVYYPEDLRRSVRVLLGLRHADVYSAERIGRAIGWNTRNPDPAGPSWIGNAAKVRQLARVVDNSKNAVVQLVAIHGLPLTALAHLEGNVSYRCPDCGHRRYSVPCYQCAANWDPRLEQDEERPLIEPDFPTQEPPGSKAKIDLMAERVSLGQSPFHEEDARIDHGPPVIPRIEVFSLGRLEREWDYRE